MGKLKQLSLFLLFREKNPTQHYVAESSRTVIFLFLIVAVFSLPLGMIMLWLLTVNVIAFFAVYLSLGYLLLQALHVYDYYRATRRG